MSCTWGQNKWRGLCNFEDYYLHMKILCSDAFIFFHEDIYFQGTGAQNIFNISRRRWTLLQPLKLYGDEDFKHTVQFIMYLPGGHSNTRWIYSGAENTIERFLPLAFVHPRLQLWLGYFISAGSLMWRD